MNALISIVIPIYNVEKYLVKCIESIINQTYDNLEIILVNDGSPDNSPAICAYYAKLDSRITIINKVNGGLSDARNVGLEKAKGEYIVFVDGDDYIEINTIEKAYSSIKINDSDLAIWGYIAEYVDRHENIEKVEIHSIQDANYDNRNFEEIKLSIEKTNLIGYAWNKMYRTENIRKNNLIFVKGLSLVEDMVFNSEMLKHSEKIVFLSDPLTHYMQRPRETLGAKFYEDYFELKMMGVNSFSSLLTHWNIDRNHRNEILSLLRFNIIKATIRKVNAATQYSYNEKIKYLQFLLNNEDVKRTLDNFEASSLKDKIIVSLAKRKNIRLLLMAYSAA